MGGALKLFFTKVFHEHHCTSSFNDIKLGLRSTDGKTYEFHSLQSFQQIMLKFDMILQIFRQKRLQTFIFIQVKWLVLYFFFFFIELSYETKTLDSLVFGHSWMDYNCTWHILKYPGMLRETAFTMVVLHFMMYWLMSNLLSLCFVQCLLGCSWFCLLWLLLILVLWFCGLMVIVQ